MNGTGRGNVAAGLRFHPEAPLSVAERESLDRHRLDPPIRVIGGQLADWFNQQDEARRGRSLPPPAVIMGLLGGLGQGKSTVLHAVLEQIERRRISRDFGAWLNRIPRPQVLPFVRPPRVLRVDTSLTKAERIEDKLFGLLLFPHLTWGAIRGFALLSLPFLVTFVLMSSATVQLLADWIVAGLVGGVGAAIVALAASVGKDLGKDWYGNLSDVVVFKLARFLLVTPELLVIDDLDRAKVEQQRAVLRALYKHARMLNCVVVVCFDEQELLANKVEPDSPDELLRKVLNFSVRIPPRTQEDALLLATGICEDWVMRNPFQPLAGAVTGPEFAAYLARAAWLLDQVGPRRIKDLLAQTLMMAATRNVSGTRELIALLRLASLYQMLPDARNDSESLIRLLENNRQDGFDAYLSARVKDDALRAKVLRLLRRTRAQQPAVLGWRALLGLDVTPPPGMALVPTQNWKPALWQVQSSVTAQPPVEHARQFCLDVHEELERVRAGYRPTEIIAADVITTAFHAEGPSNEAAVGMFVLGAAVEEAAVSRLALYRYWRERLLAADADCQQRCLPVCLREWVADEEVWRLLTRDERCSLLEPPPLVPVASLGSLALLVAPGEDDFPILLRFSLRHFSTRSEYQRAAALLRAAPVRLAPTDLDGIGDMETALSVLGSVWPPLRPVPTNPKQSVEIPMQALGLLQERAGHGVLPDGVIEGLDFRGTFDPRAWLPGIRGLLKPGKAWRLGYWHDCWQTHMPFQLRAWIGQNLQPQRASLDEAEVLTLLALCIADEFWSGLDTLLPMPKKPLSQIQDDIKLLQALTADPTFIAAMPEWAWFWLDHLPDPDKNIRDTVQARLIEVVLTAQRGREQLGSVAQLFRKEYETLPVDGQAPGGTDRRQYLVAEIYQTYFRDFGATAGDDMEAIADI